MNERKTTLPGDSVSSGSVQANSSAISGESPAPPRSIRRHFAAELDQLRMQIEVMALKVDHALQRSTQVLLTGDLELAQQVIASDDEIDAMVEEIYAARERGAFDADQSREILKAGRRCSTFLPARRRASLPPCARVSS